MSIELNKNLVKRFAKEFLGYGNLNSKIWFVGMEPGAPDDKEKLKIFFDSWEIRGCPKIDDLRKSHESIEDDHYRNLFGPKPKYQKTWSGLIRILLSMSDKDKSLSNASVKAFQNDSLGKHRGGRHALLELFAIPCKSIRADYWDKHYKSVFNISKAEYLKKFSNERIKLFANLIAKQKPKKIIFYGTSYMKFWEKIVGDGFISVNKCNVDFFEKKSKGIHIIICSHPASRKVRINYFQTIGIRLISK